jgi:hypothetical protein
MYSVVKRSDGLYTITPVAEAPSLLYPGEYLFEPQNYISPPERVNLQNTELADCYAVISSSAEIVDGMYRILPI